MPWNFIIIINNSYYIVCKLFILRERNRHIIISREITGGKVSLYKKTYTVVVIPPCECIIYTIKWCFKVQKYTLRYHVSKCIMVLFFIILLY